MAINHNFLFSDPNPAEWVAFAGHANQAQAGSSSAPQIKQVKQIVMKTDGSGQDTVALIRLSEPLQLSSSVKLICIAEKDPEHGQLCLTAGWSTQNANGMHHFN